MMLRDLAGKHVAVLGYGKEGSAVLQAIRDAGIDCAVTVLDAKPDLRVDGVETVGGGAYLDDLGSYDVIVKSPGIPPDPRIDAARDRVTSGTRIFFDTVLPAGTLIIGITGSKGKSTTTSLIHACLLAGGKRSVLVGNIGLPAIARIADAAPGTIFTYELSSYQLMDLHVSPPVAVVTAFFPEHLDYHGSLEAYLDAKKNIARHQTDGDAVFFNALSPGAAEIAAEGRGRKIPFEPADAPVRLEDTRLIGEHNLGNIAAAWKVASELGVAERDAVAAITAFTPLPHRLQALGEHAGIRWVDDAISTTPESAIAALDALGDDAETIILGGQDRGIDFTLLGRRLAESSIRTALLFPGSGPRIRAAIEAADTGRRITLVEVADMETAVRLAREHTAPGKTVLLSTASPSYGMFRNFEEKGDQFREEVERLEG